MNAARITQHSRWLGYRQGALTRFKVVATEFTGVREKYTELSYDLEIEGTKEKVNVPAEQMQELIKNGQLKQL